MSHGFKVGDEVPDVCGRGRGVIHAINDWAVQVLWSNGLDRWHDAELLAHSVSDYRMTDLERITRWLDKIDAIRIPTITDERLQQIVARLLEAINDAREKVTE